jgi:hypothetical protein
MGSSLLDELQNRTRKYRDNTLERNRDLIEEIYNSILERIREAASDGMSELHHWGNISGEEEAVRAIYQEIRSRLVSQGLSIRQDLRVREYAQPYCFYISWAGGVR